MKRTERLLARVFSTEILPLPSRTKRLIAFMLGLPFFAVFFFGDWRMGQTLFHLWAGWGRFIMRSSERMQVNVGGLATAAVCAGALVVGGHYFFSWLYRSCQTAETPSLNRESHWKFQWTFYGLVLVVTIFAAGISAVGVFHQIGWLITADRETLARNR